MDTTLLLLCIALVLYLGASVRQWRHLNRKDGNLIPRADPMPRDE